MKITKIKYTKEFQYHGISEWIGVEASTDGSEVKNELLSLRNTLVETFNLAINQGSDAPVINISEKIDYSGDADFELLKSELEKIQFREDAQKHIEEKGWGFAVEAKLLVSQKPNKK